MIAPVGVVALPDNSVFIAHADFVDPITVDHFVTKYLFVQGGLRPFIHSHHPSIFGEVAPSGRLIRLPDGGGGHAILEWQTNGRISRIDPVSATRLSTSILNAFLDASRVFDVASGEVADFQSLLVPPIFFGDLAVFPPSAPVDLLLTGVAGGSGVAFVLRVRPQGEGVLAQVLVASAETTRDPPGENRCKPRDPFDAPSCLGNVNQPRGIAVNADGLVLTNLPRPMRTDLGSAIKDDFVSFPADLRAGSRDVDCGLPPRPCGDDRAGPSFTSWGMTASDAGDFYVAPGVVGNAICQLPGVPNATNLMRVSASLQRVTCLVPIDPGGRVIALSGTRDVALAGTDRLLLVTETQDAVTTFGSSRALVFAVPEPGPFVGWAAAAAALTLLAGARRRAQRRPSRRRSRAPERSPSPGRNRSGRTTCSGSRRSST